MTGDKDTHHRTTFSLPVKADTFFGKCWWSDQVFPGSQQAYRDFVLVSEFSELEGPVPLAVVSETTYIDLKEYTTPSSSEQRQQMLTDLHTLGLERFDFNAFALRVVSTDRSADYYDQSHLCKSSTNLDSNTPVAPSAFLDQTKDHDIGQHNDTTFNNTKNTFFIPDDTQVYFTDSDLKFFSFTHHLTLFDINARGYVHPVALSYITRDTEKIISRFEDFMNRFNQVSRLMKKGNYANFILDLKCRLLDLEYTEYLITTDNQKTLSTSTTAEHNNHSNNPGECLSTEALRQAHAATTLMIDTMETYATQWVRTHHEDDDDVSPTIDDEKQVTIDPTEIIEPTKDYKPKYIDTLYPVAHFDRKLRSLSQLCHEPDMRSTSQHDQNGTQQQRRSLHNNTSVIPLVSIIEPKQRKHTKRAKRRLFDNATNHDMYTEAIKYMTDLTAELGRSSISLYLEEEDALHKEPVSQAITFGHVFMLNLEDPHLRRETSSYSLYSEYGNKMVADHQSSKEKQAPGLTVDTLQNARNDIDTIRSETDRQERLISENNEESNHYSPLFATAQLWESKQKRNYGNLLHILEKHQQYIHHVIYSLLTGRPVVIMGNAQAKSRIQQIVDALSIFVPGLSKSHHQILSWFTGEKLDDESLASIKLVGTTKDKIDPSIYRLDISCLEVDHQNGNGSLVTSPLYLDGQWVYEMLSKMSYYTSDESYIAYLHTRFMNMSLRAYIYHHKYLEQDDRGHASEAASTYLTTTSSIDTLHTDKEGFISTATSCTGSPCEEDRREPLGKKWSVRRIMNYLKRVEDGDPEDYFGQPRTSMTTTNTSSNLAPTTLSVASIPRTSSSSCHPMSPGVSTSSLLSTSSSPLPPPPPPPPTPATEPLSIQESGSEDEIINDNNTKYPIPSRSISASQEQHHLQQRYHQHRHQHQINQEHSNHHPPSSRSTQSSSISVPIQDETPSDHYSEDNEATVTLENIQNQPYISVTQLNWTPPPLSTKATTLAVVTTSPSPSPSTTSEVKVLDTQCTRPSIPVDRRRISEAFSDITTCTDLTSSRRNSGSNASTTYLSALSDSGDVNDDNGDDDFIDYNDIHWKHIMNGMRTISEDDKSLQQAGEKTKQNQEQLHSGGFDKSASSIGSFSSERRGYDFLEQTLHVIGDDQTIVMYLASLNMETQHFPQRY